VYGGQSMPVELIVDEVESGLTGKKSTNVAMSSIMGGVVNQDDVAHFMRSI
jgi:pyruvate ferredoxin oxidoreductase alpha subunit